jgi:NADH-quinone oxidoreductase subunit C
VSDDRPPGSDVAPTEQPAEPELFHGAPVSWSRGQRVVHPTRDAYLTVVKALVDDAYDVFVDLTAVDYLAYGGRPLPAGVAPERFEVVVNLLSMQARDRVRVRVGVPEADPVVTTLFDLFPGAEASEREVFDMFGISFDGHPDLNRILMPEDWVGYPLRKDFAVGRIPVQFKGAPAAR